VAVVSGASATFAALRSRAFTGFQAARGIARLLDTLSEPLSRCMRIDICDCWISAGLLNRHFMRLLIFIVLLAPPAKLALVQLLTAPGGA